MTSFVWMIICGHRQTSVFCGTNLSVISYHNNINNNQLIHSLLMWNYFAIIILIPLTFTWAGVLMLLCHFHNVDMFRFPTDIRCIKLQLLLPEKSVNMDSFSASKRFLVLCAKLKTISIKFAFGVQKEPIFE